MICKNSTGKVFGEVFIEENRLIIKHNTKPEIIVDEPEIVHRVLNIIEQFNIRFNDESVIHKNL